jgi:hypothetical protein
MLQIHAAGRRRCDSYEIAFAPTTLLIDAGHLEQASRTMAYGSHEFNCEAPRTQEACLNLMKEQKIMRDMR